MCDEIISAMIDLGFPAKSGVEKQRIECNRQAKGECDAFLLLEQGEGDFDDNHA